MISIRVRGQLLYLDTPDDCVNWLYVNGHKEAARALNAHIRN